MVDIKAIRAQTNAELEKALAEVRQEANLEKMQLDREIVKIGNDIAKTASSSSSDAEAVAQLQKTANEMEEQKEQLADIAKDCKIATEILQNYFNVNMQRLIDHDKLSKFDRRIKEESTEEEKEVYSVNKLAENIRLAGELIKDVQSACMESGLIETAIITGVVAEGLKHLENGAKTNDTALFADGAEKLGLNPQKSIEAMEHFNQPKIIQEKQIPTIEI